VIYAGNPFGVSELTYGPYYGAPVNFAPGQYYGTGFYTPGLYRPMPGYAVYPGYSGASGYGRGYADPFNVRYPAYALSPFGGMQYSRIPYSGWRR
jgi:hypothetical protein